MIKIIDDDNGLGLYYYNSGSTPNQNPHNPPSFLLPSKPHGRLCTWTSRFREDGIWVLPFPSIFSSNVFTFIPLDFNFIVFSVFDFYLYTGATITGEDAGFGLLVAMKFTHAVIVITKQRYLFLLFVKFSFVFILNLFDLFWSGSSFIIRACWKTLLITTNSFVRMLNK